MVAFCELVCSECPGYIATQKETSMTNFIFRMMTTVMKIRKKGLVNVETILSGLDTGLPDESVDIILLYNVLPIIENWTDLIKELYRVLRSGGVLSAKSSLGVNLYSREKIKTNDLEKLMIDKGPLKLKKKIGKFYIFEKNNEEDKLLKETKKNGL